MLGEFQKILVKRDITIKEATRLMDETGEKILFFVDQDDRLIACLTDGDIRRWLLKEGNLQESVKKIYRTSPRMLKEGFRLSDAKKVMIEQRLDALPVIDSERHVIDVLIWSQIFQGEEKQKRNSLGIPVLIMAGGKGTRLDPFTKILPKPLIPFGEKPILEIIMDRFAECGCNDFYLTVNYKGKMIQSYFDNADCSYRLNFIWEEEFLGTAGSIFLVKDELKAPHLFVSNCDILIKSDYHDIYNFHIQQNSDVTVIGSMRHISIPYGVLEMKNGGTLTNIIEKPEYDFFVNTGLYLIKREVIQHIPEKTKFDFPDLIMKVRETGGRVSVYPISQQSWVDIGQWQEYHGAIKDLECP